MIKILTDSFYWVISTVSYVVKKTKFLVSNKYEYKRAPLAITLLLHHWVALRSKFWYLYKEKLPDVLLSHLVYNIWSQFIIIINITTASVLNYI